MTNCEFFNTECIDGYFSGTIYLYEGNNKRYILDFGYDIEFEKPILGNCDNFLFNSNNEHYTIEEISDILTSNYYLLIEEFKYYIKFHYTNYYNLK